MVKEEDLIKAKVRTSLEEVKEKKVVIALDSSASTLL